MNFANLSTIYSDFRAICWTLAVFAALAAVLPLSARAQNLVQDPNFSQGLTFYTTSGDVFPSEFGPTGSSAVVYSASLSGEDTNGTVTQVIPTSPGVTYMVSFLANVDPDTTDSVLVTFGTGQLTLNTQSTTDLNFDQFSFTGNALPKSSDTALTFTALDGAFAITSLDVEGAPAPVPGGGLASFAAGLAALTALGLHRMRRPA